MNIQFVFIAYLFKCNGLIFLMMSFLSSFSDELLVPLFWGVLRGHFGKSFCLIFIGFNCIFGIDTITPKMNGSMWRSKRPVLDEFPPFADGLADRCRVMVH